MFHLKPFKKPIVFAGPSIELWPDQAKKSFDIKPPIRRGDLDFLMEEEPGVCILIDGVFGGKMAISPTECRQLLERGWHLIGSSSMGALRAADLWSLGMLGIGEIYTFYRLGVCLSDADVAVVYNTETYKEVTISLVHLKNFMRYLVENQIVDYQTSLSLLDEIKKIPWFERFPQYLKDLWGQSPKIIKAFDIFLDSPRLNPKKRDALLTYKFISQMLLEKPFIATGGLGQ